MRFIFEKITRMGFGWNERSQTEADFYSICKRLRVSVVEMPLRTNGFYYRVLGRDYIAIDSRLAGAKKLLVQFHELAHFLLHVPDSGATANFHGVGQKTRQEREADAVAICSLIPRTMLDEIEIGNLSEDAAITPEMLGERVAIFERYGF